MKYEPMQTIKDEHAMGLCYGCDNRIIARAAKYMYPGSGWKAMLLRFRMRMHWHRMLHKALTHGVEPGSQIVNVMFTIDALRTDTGTKYSDDHGMSHTVFWDDHKARVEVSMPDDDVVTLRVVRGPYTEKPEEIVVEVERSGFLRLLQNSEILARYK